MLSTAKCLQRAIATRGALTRCLSTTPIQQRHSLVPRSPLDDQFFGTTSKFLRGLEHEFESARRRMERNFANLIRSDESMLMSDEDNMVWVDKDGKRHLRLVFNVKDFDPENIKLSTRDNCLVVSAKREKKSADTYYLNEFSQSYSLPPDLKTAELKSKYTDDGLLVVEAPLPALEASKEKVEEKKVRELPIEHENK